MYKTENCIHGPHDSTHVPANIFDNVFQYSERGVHLALQAPMYYRKANAAMLVFDITSMDSFGDMKTWVNGKVVF